MHIGEVVGGVAVVGVAVLIGLAVVDDREPDTVTTDTSPFVFEAGSSSTSTAEPVASSTEAPGTRMTPETTAETRPRQPSATVPVKATDPTHPPSTPPRTTSVPTTTTTLIPLEDRATIALRVLNGGAPAQSATFLTGILRDAGFDPVPPADASTLVDRTWVLFAPGADIAAHTVNDVVEAPPANVVAAGDDPNWAQYGADLAVLVVLGPPAG